MSKQLIALLQLRCTYTRKCICTNIQNMNIHSYTIQISGPIGLFSNKWANGTKLDPSIKKDCPYKRLNSITTSYSFVWLFVCLFVCFLSVFVVLA